MLTTRGLGRYVTVHNQSGVGCRMTQNMESLHGTTLRGSTPGHSPGGDGIVDIPIIKPQSLICTDLVTRGHGRTYLMRKDKT
jgi:hypothetical protein